jgi:hypothetical protein
LDDASHWLMLQFSGKMYVEYVTAAGVGARVSLDATALID